jgi:drug/metabolite transporter (DMT)-like permease
VNRTAIIYAFASAALFGASTPAAKLLVGMIHPAVLAGLLYCGAGIGVALLRWLPAGILHSADAAEGTLRRTDVPWLAAAIVFGGIIGPILLMAGLTTTDGATASLLLTLEGAATALLAWFVFGENFDRRIALGLVLLLAGAAVLSWSGTPSLAGLLGPAAIVGACIAWGLDNNLTRKVSLADPLQIVQWKGLIAGPINLALGLWAGGVPPDVTSGLIAGIVGFFGYGVSLVLFVLALRDLGAARTSAYFSTAPFIGAMIALALLGEPFTVQLLAAGVLMAIGVWLHLSEKHEHEHVHEPMTHEHPHVHDEHHRHEHGPNDPPGEPHTHVHRHRRMRHTHPHVPDMHHLHRHNG